MTLSEQVNAAIAALKGLFKNAEPLPLIPEDMTLPKLWAMYCEATKGKKKRYSPGVEESVRLLLEDTRLAEIPIPMIAEIVREVFIAYGLKCSCSESSVRWYQSQRNLEWSIVRRRQPRVEVQGVVTVDSETPEG
jgi:hypothetical protein